MVSQGGKWNDEQILPSGWVQYSTTPTNAFSGYGAGWWLQFPGKAIHASTDSCCTITYHRVGRGLPDLGLYETACTLDQLRTFPGFFRQSVMHCSVHYACADVATCDTTFGCLQTMHHDGDEVLKVLCLALQGRQQGHSMETGCWGRE